MVYRRSCTQNGSGNALSYSPIFLVEMLPLSGNASNASLSTTESRELPITSGPACTTMSTQLLIAISFI